ncbi:hypothetical protein DF107_02655 [Burkholderia stagnalis]|nr:hypothetical protein DF161_00615 [Burkholderia stagnalis]RQY84957.1 hypothetical protein DF107_02655 [Burkholderia stagnalis]
MWFDCLRLNEDYEAYCDAKLDCDTTICRQLEGKHPCLAEVFADWGDIFDGVSYPEWIGKRMHLFFVSEPTVKWDDASREPGTVTISIPLGFSKVDLTRMLKDFVAANEDRLCAEPKYPVHGHLTVEKLLTLSRGAMAYDLLNSAGVEPHEKYRDRKSLQDYSYTNVARSVLGNAVMYREYALGVANDIWSRTPAIPAGEDTWSYDDLKPYMEAVGKWIDYYKKCIESAIRGTFPAKT